MADSVCAARAMRSCESGAAAIEFALAVPLFLALMFGVIEYARFVWTIEAVQETATAGAQMHRLDAGRLLGERNLQPVERRHVHPVGGAEVGSDGAGGEHCDIDRDVVQRRIRAFTAPGDLYVPVRRPSADRLSCQRRGHHGFGLFSGLRRTMRRGWMRAFRGRGVGQIPLDLEARGEFPMLWA